MIVPFSLSNGARGELDSNQYGTPQAFFDVCSRVFGSFDVDLCASDEPTMHKCDRYFTAERSCLRVAEWTTAWCNPPYSEGSIGPIIEHVYRVALAGKGSTLCLFPIKKSEQVWFQNYVANAATMILPVEGRIPFLRHGMPTKAPNHASVLVWYRSGMVLGSDGFVGPICHGWNQVVGATDDVVELWKELGFFGCKSKTGEKP